MSMIQSEYSDPNELTKAVRIAEERADRMTDLLPNGDFSVPLSVSASAAKHFASKGPHMCITSTCKEEEGPEIPESLIKVSLKNLKLPIPEELAKSGDSVTECDERVSLAVQTLKLLRSEGILSVKGRYALGRYHDVI